MPLFGGRAGLIKLHPRDSHGGAAAFVFGGEDGIDFVGCDGAGGFEGGGCPGDVFALGGGEGGGAFFFFVIGVAAAPADLVVGDFGAVAGGLFEAGGLCFCIPGAL